ncbi:MAG: PIN domain-containing protein [Chthoniobacteraceae bacterium]
MRLLLDTNVVLDVLLARAPFDADGARIMSAVETGAAEGFLCATTVITIHYLAAKAVGRKTAEKHIGSLLRIFNIAAVTDVVLSSALGSKAKDFEDAVLLEAARAVSADAIVTRNPSDFRKSSGISIHMPADLLRILGL